MTNKSLILNNIGHILKAIYPHYILTCHTIIWTRDSVGWACHSPSIILTDDGHQVMAKAHIAFGKVS